jgi:hypothetical protein
VRIEQVWRVTSASAEEVSAWSGNPRRFRPAPVQRVPYLGLKPSGERPQASSGRAAAAQVLDKVAASRFIALAGPRRQWQVFAGAAPLLPALKGAPRQPPDPCSPVGSTPRCARASSRWKRWDERSLRSPETCRRWKIPQGRRAACSRLAGAGAGQTPAPRPAVVDQFEETSQLLRSRATRAAFLI